MPAEIALQVAAIGAGGLITFLVSWWAVRRTTRDLNAQVQRLTGLIGDLEQVVRNTDSARLTRDEKGMPSGGTTAIVRWRVGVASGLEAGPEAHAISADRLDQDENVPDNVDRPRC